MPRLDRYQNPQVYEPLAADYVLGGLHGRARQRFKRLLDERAYVQQAVEAWQRRLNPFTERISGVTPPERVWRNIQAEIAALERHAEAPRKGGFWNSLRAWRAMAFVALAAIAMVGVGQLIPRPEAPTLPAYVAVLKGKQDQPMMVATASLEPMRITVMMTGDVRMPSAGDLELWCVSKRTGRALSMGVLEPRKETMILLSQDDWDMLGENMDLAISVEPKGGSQSGRPTGPVMYTGAIVSLI